MNRFNADYLNGLPYYGDDFIFITTYLKEALDNMLRQYAFGSNPNFKINGIVETITPGVDCAVTAGYAYLNGEYLKVDAQTVPRTAGTDIYVIIKSTSTDAAGNRDLKNTGATVTPWELNRGIVTNVASVATNQLDVEGNTITSKIIEAIGEGTDTTLGLFETATQAEADALTADNKVITPARIPETTTTQKGILRAATNVEAKGSTGIYAITPEGLANRLATTSQTGILETATQTESNTLTAVDKIVTPGTLPSSTDTQVGLARQATTAETQAGTLDNVIVSPLKLRTQEDWIEVGSGAPAPAFLNGWVIGSGYCKFRKNNLGHLEIVIKNIDGSSATNPVVFQLPTGYRIPVASDFSVVSSSSTLAAAKLASNGNVQLGTDFTYATYPFNPQFILIVPIDW